MAIDSKGNRKRHITTNIVFQKDTFFLGNLETQEPLQINGSFEGFIQSSSHITVATEGKVKANIESGTITIYGHVEGHLVATEKVSLKKGATLIGNICSPKLEIDDGVIFEGKCEMKSPPPSKKS